jgi:hypothetical protein
MGGQWRVVTRAAEFAALAGSRQVEFLGLHWSRIRNTEIRLMRAKQRAGVEKVEKVEISPALADLLAWRRMVARDDSLSAVYPNRHRNPYAGDGFASM